MHTVLFHRDKTAVLNNVTVVQDGAKQRYRMIVSQHLVGQCGICVRCFDACAVVGDGSLIFVALQLVTRHDEIAAALSCCVKAASFVVR